MSLSRLMRVLLLLLAAAGGDPVGAVRHRAPGSTVSQCSGVSLTASYLAEAAPGAGPGFLFHIQNNTAKQIRLAQPVPSSAHWYARAGGRWLWRASAGRGGALVDAERTGGPMFAYRPLAASEGHADLVVPAHGSRDWAEAMRDHPAIAYKPSCPMCNYPGEREYQAVFAYAYLPGPGDDAADLLSCGLRSEPVPMPPLALEGSALPAQ